MKDIKLTVEVDGVSKMSEFGTGTTTTAEDVGKVCAWLYTLIVNDDATSKKGNVDR